MKDTVIAFIQQLIVVALIMACLAGLHFLQSRLDEHHANTPKVQRFMYLPRGDVLRVASLGFHAVAADGLWLQAIQTMGEKSVSPESGRWIYQVLDVVTTLDPKFVQAYEVGGLALCTVVVLPEESNALLEKGMRHNPDVWQLPFYLGVNYYFELGDHAKAAEYIGRAARLPGVPAPERLANFAARLYSSSRDPQSAIDVLMQLFEQTEDENLRQALGRRIKEAIVERDLQLLERAISLYNERHKRVPDRLDELVGPGLLSNLPLDPFGEAYLYNSATQTVRSSSVSERLQARKMRRIK